MAQVQCPKCQSKIAVTPRLSGRLVKCKCGSKLRMPEVKSDLPPMAQAAAPMAQAAAPMAQAAAPMAQAAAPMAQAAPVVAAAPALAPIRFQCPQCSVKLQVAGDMGGRASQCNCGMKFRIPTPNTPAPVDDEFAYPPIGSQAATSDPFANDPFANPGVMSAVAPGIDPLTGYPAGQQPALPNVAGKPRKKKKGSRKKRMQQKQQREEESNAAMYSIGSGIFMMVGSVVWFVAALMAGYVFPYSIILFFIGLATMIKGFYDACQ